MTPPVWVQQLAARSPGMYSRLFRFCFRCDQVRWRRHRHPASNPELVIARHLGQRLNDRLGDRLGDNDWRNV